MVVNWTRAHLTIASLRCYQHVTLPASAFGLCGKSNLRGLIDVIRRFLLESIELYRDGFVKYSHSLESWIVQAPSRLFRSIPGLARPLFSWGEK